jgi:hypothetical protein
LAVGQPQKFLGARSRFHLPILRMQHVL